jgi:hypothetical protein
MDVLACGGYFRPQACKWIEIQEAMLYMACSLAYLDQPKRLKAMRQVLDCTSEHFTPPPPPRKAQHKSRKPTVRTGTADLKGKKGKRAKKKREVAWWQAGRALNCPSSKLEPCSQPEHLTQSPPKPAPSPFDFPPTSEGTMHTTLCTHTLTSFFFLFAEKASETKRKPLALETKRSQDLRDLISKEEGIELPLPLPLDPHMLCAFTSLCKSHPEYLIAALEQARAASTCLLSLLSLILPGLMLSSFFLNFLQCTL